MALRTLRKTGTLVGLALLLSAVMIVGVIALVAALRPDDGGSKPAAAADRMPTSAPAATPSSAPTSAPTSSEPSLGIDPTSATRPSSSPVAKSVPPRTTTPATPKAKKSITYVVKRGDNLTVIAEWFKQHGYGKLYDRNRKVIGSDPDLIRPGQKITISSGGMTTSR